MMKQILMTLVAMMALAFGTVAFAHGHVHIGVGIYGPGYSVGISNGYGGRGYYRHDYDRRFRGYYGYQQAYPYPNPFQYGVTQYETVPLYCVNYNTLGEPYSYVCGYRQVAVLVP